MNEMRWLIAESAERIFRTHCTKEVVDAAEQGTWPDHLWRELVDAELTQISVPTDQGGAGGEVGDAMAVLRQAGKFAVPLPLAETMLAGWLLSGSGAQIPTQPLTVAPTGPDREIQTSSAGDQIRIVGSLSNVAFAKQASHIAILVDHDGSTKIALVAIGGCQDAAGTNLAGEPISRVTFDNLSLSPDDLITPASQVSAERFLQLGALTRVTMMAGALETVLSLTVQHANDRMQFGRPIGKFQAVRQQIAVLGTEVAAAGKACDEAVAAFDAGEDPVRIAVAKARVSESAGICNEIAHQFHGAIGFTYEHSLHQFTRRLWSWRDDYGSEAYWNERLGRTLQTFGPERPWEFLTGIS